jgi:hypothetical protein
MLECNSAGKKHYITDFENRIHLTQVLRKGILFPLVYLLTID